MMTWPRIPYYQVYASCKRNDWHSTAFGQNFMVHIHIQEAVKCGTLGGQKLTLVKKKKQPSKHVFVCLFLLKNL